MSTIFTKIIKGEVPAAFVYRDDLVSAFMDVQPINPGHVIVVTNQEISCLAELDEETGIHLFKTAHRIALALRKSELKCEGVNIFLADGEAAEQNICHVHIHVFPRFIGDNCQWKFKKDYSDITNQSELYQTATSISKALNISTL